jgi:hypothetical protein
MNFKIIIAAAFACALGLSAAHAAQGDAGIMSGVPLDENKADKKEAPAVTQEPDEPEAQEEPDAEPAGAMPPSAPVKSCKERCMDRCKTDKRAVFERNCSASCANSCKPNGRGLFKCKDFYAASLQDVLTEMYGTPFRAGKTYFLDSNKEARKTVTARIAALDAKVKVLRNDKNALAVEAAMFRLRGSMLRSDEDVLIIYKGYRVKLKNWEKILRESEARPLRNLFNAEGNCPGKLSSVYREIDGSTVNELLGTYEACGYPEPGLTVFFHWVLYDKRDCLRTRFWREERPHDGLYGGF